MNKKSGEFMIEAEDKILIYTSDDGKIKVEVFFEDENIWLNQDQISVLFNKAKSTINEHIKNIYEEQELKKEYSMRKFGKTEFSTKPTNYYNLEMIIAIGYRVKSNRGTQFRIWANDILKNYLVKGYNLNVERFKNNGGGVYFEEVLEKIRDIRSSEKVFWRKVLDIYATSIDYDAKDEKTKEFFRTIQNKMHYAVHGNTAAEIIVNRANHKKTNMGLTNWKNSPNGKIIASDVTVAKNYLTKEELKSLERIVAMYLDYAEDQAERHIPMTMEDWKGKLDVFLQFNERDVLNNPGKVSHKVAESFALSEFEKYRIIQDKLFESDFDKFMFEMKNDDINN